MNETIPNTTETTIHKEADMALDTTTATPAATLTQSELFARFLEAKLRLNAPQSALIKDPEISDATAEEWFLGWHGCDSACFDYDFVDRMLDELRVCENPEAELETAVDDLRNLLDGIKFLHREFRAVCERTLAEPPEDTGDEDADEAAFREYENNPRYILPVIEQKEAA